VFYLRSLTQRPYATGLKAVDLLFPLEEGVKVSCVTKLPCAVAAARMERGPPEPPDTHACVGQVAIRGPGSQCGAALTNYLQCLGERPGQAHTISRPKIIPYTNNSGGGGTQELGGELERLGVSTLLTVTNTGTSSVPRMSIDALQSYSLAVSTGLSEAHAEARELSLNFLAMHQHLQEMVTWVGLNELDPTDRTIYERARSNLDLTSVAALLALYVLC
jgi:hypothetical protein